MVDITVESSTDAKLPNGQKGLHNPLFVNKVDSLEQTPGIACYPEKSDVSASSPQHTRLKTTTKTPTISNCHKHYNTDKIYMFLWYLWVVGNADRTVRRIRATLRRRYVD
ncbi:unnamed protein product [Arctia plantaginis]|uniref:Uncharacterized protein n=1 Tax=Arctia plantaginis TaxID=874455 RepID=A0A8S0ZW64_ARCPL|nr:unnamed protein product [Arctia plantaginis]